MSTVTLLHTPVKSGFRWERRALQEKSSPRSANKTPRKTPGQGDRFIPNRSAMDMEVARFTLTLPTKENNSVDLLSPGKEQYKKHLAENLLKEKRGGGAGVNGTGGEQASSRILAFKGKAPAPAEGHQSAAAVLYSQNSSSAPHGTRKAFRHVPQAAERILDAPELVDDYYLNLLDWSSDNVVAVALGGTVYLWDAAGGTIEELMHVRDDGDDYVTSVSWAPDGKHIAVGLSDSVVQLWDSAQLKQVRSMKGHTARVGALAWNGGPILSSGGRDNLIINHDVRVREHITSRLTGHEQEVCGLKWSPSGQQLASGGNDNLLHVWDAAVTSSNPNNAANSAPAQQWLHRLDHHRAAVKALAWCPFQSNLLASGGGSADRCIKFWNTHTGACVNSIDTHSQVCALEWSKHDREILSSHGFSQNQLCLWKYPSMAKVAELTGHTARVLHMAQSPDGSMVVSAAADETLRFWKAFGGPDSSTAARLAGSRSGKGLLPTGKSGGSLSSRSIHNIR
eukprot:jgi/Mesen1/9870/ME000070S09154